MRTTTKLTTNFRIRLLGQSLLACLMTTAMIVPQFASANGLNHKLKNTPATTGKPANNSQGNPRVVNNPNALFQPKVTITPASPTVAQQTQFTPQTSPPPASEDRRVVPPVPQDPRSIPPINTPVQPQMPGRVPGVVPPFRRLITPPVGDIAVSTFPYQPDQVDLGSNERITRLNLQATPAFVVLSSLARAAGLSVYPVPNSIGVGGEAPPADQGINLPITLDIENQTVQNAFNDILRISGLQASRIGDRIFVGARLPINLQNLTTRSLRLNQISVGDASAYLISLGAERVVNRQRPIPGVQAATAIGPGGTAVVPPVQLESVPTLERLTGASQFSKPILQGLQVIGEERGNTITLIGPKNLVAFAEAQLARLDIRKRQVAVNVRVLEVQLDRGQTFSTNFAFGILGSTGGLTSLTGPSPEGIRIGTNNPVATPFINITALQNAANVKTLTDPTLIIQEGESALISLVETVVQRFIPAVAGAGEQGSTPAQITTADVGLRLNINIAKIDDNGFINLSVAPTVIAPGLSLPGLSGGAFELSISTRALTSGQIRIRDNQTLVLAGVIRDNERNSVTKVPILGDIPILGALFRFESNDTRRSEVVILVTPRIIDDSQNANWGYTYQPSPQPQQVIDGNQITLPQNQDNRLNRLDQR